MYKNEKLLNLADHAEVKVVSEGKEFNLTRLEMGDLFLPTGKIVANDPFVLFETEPFTHAVPPGHYPVQLSVASMDSFGAEDKRVAMAMLKFSDKNVARWELAIIDGQEENLGGLGDDDFFGYGVDSGTGGFMDAFVANALTTDEKYKDEDFFEKFEEELKASYTHTYDYLLADVLDSGEKNFACFSSGFGDGSYPSYFGYDDKGEICRLVTDFLVVYTDI